MNCPPPPPDKKAYIKSVGQTLLEEHGKKKFYSPEEVQKASKAVKKEHRNEPWYNQVDWSCWAMCVFTSHDDFDSYHTSIGEVCDYTEMKTSMLEGLATGSIGTSWVDLPDMDMDSSWLDFGDFFDGIGDFFAGIFEA